MRAASGPSWLVVLALLAWTAHSYRFNCVFRVWGHSSFRLRPLWCELDRVASSCQRVNSTGLFHIPGYDVSRPYPGKVVDGWTLSIAAMDISRPRTPEESEDYRVVGYSLTIKGPESRIQDAPDGTKILGADSSWGMCAWYWPQIANPTNKALADDGSCSGFLPDACITALEKQATTEYDTSPKYHTVFDTHVECNVLRAPDACGDQLGNSSIATGFTTLGGVPVRYLNGSVHKRGSSAHPSRK